MINKREIQEVNAGSMADISFLLLIFFLVATTMNVDQGINRILPPWQEDKKEMDVKERNLLFVKVNQWDEVVIDNEIVELYDIKDKVKIFITDLSGAEGSPEVEVKEIDLLGNYPVSKGIVSLQDERQTTYGMYVRVQNELQKAYNEVRDDVAMVKFGKKFAALSTEQMDAIAKAIPLSISEAQPRNMGGL